MINGRTRLSRACLGDLVRQGTILRIKRDVYGKKGVPGERGAVENLRKTSDNMGTINGLLNFYDNDVAYNRLNGIDRFNVCESVH